MVSLLCAVLMSINAYAGIAEDVASLNAHRALRGPDNVPPITAEVYQQALSGPASGIRAVEGVSAAQAWGVAVFNLPIEQVWQGLTSEGEHAGTAAPVSTSTLMSDTPHADGRLLFQFMPLPLVTDRWWIVRLKHNRTSMRPAVVACGRCIGPTRTRRGT